MDNVPVHHPRLPTDQIHLFYPRSAAEWDTGQYSYMDDPTTVGVTEGFGLMFYQARWYDPGLGRFAQADTIIPLQTQGVQAWDRYAGMNNNPVRYNDPSGHCIFCVALVLAVTVAAITPISSGPLISNLSQPRIKNDTYGAKCSASLSSCYQQGMLSTLENGQVSNDEFSQLLEAVATDVKDGMALPGLPGGYLSGRGTFDTPFYNGGGNGLEPLFPADQQVCIDSQGCGGRSEINYFAQGMWSADSGESLDDALGTTIWWNETRYNLTEAQIQGKLYWTRYGYLWYKNWREWGDDWRKHWKPPMPNPNTNNNGATPQ